MNRPTRQLVYGIGLVLLGLVLQQERYDLLSPMPTFAGLFILIGVVIGGIGAFERDR